jgi:hypothetical protein
LLVAARPSKLRAWAARQARHDQLRKVAAAFAQVDGGRLPANLRDSLPLPLPGALTTVAAALVKLQELRHIADYDLSQRVTRASAEDAFFRATVACAAWMDIRRTDHARLFLGMVLFPEGARR